MVELKCPRCGQSAQLPEHLIADNHQCYRCQVPLVVMDPTFHERRTRTWNRHGGAILAGIVLGGIVLPWLCWLGGPTTMLIAAGLAGFSLGAIFGVAQWVGDSGKVLGLVFDKSWGTYVTIILGTIGAVLYVYFYPTISWQPMHTLSLSALGGGFVGGWIGHFLCKPRYKSNELPGPSVG